MPRLPVLVVQHEPACPPGRLLGWAAEAGVILDVRECHRGDTLPASLWDHGGLIVLGGQRGVYDDVRHPWLVTAKSLVIQSVLHEIPFLGVSLGYQLAGLALGGRVAPHPYVKDFGVEAVTPTLEAAEDLLTAGLRQGDRWIQFNNDVISEAPGGSVVLARDRWGQIQIIRFARRAWGFQGHPEADAPMIARWGPIEPATPSEVDQRAAIVLAAEAQGRHAAPWAGVAGRFFALVTTPGDRGRSSTPPRPHTASSNAATPQAETDDA
ncbi:MAG: type 1 glutamine amidotransferase [Dermatophilaceae bacterium]